MEIRLYPELNKSSYPKYHLPVDHWDIPAGAPIPVVGDKLTFMVLKPQHPSEWLEPRTFEVIERRMYLQTKIEDQSLFRYEITLVLADITKD